jgi:DNA end-binding protein Ku
MSEKEEEAGPQPRRAFWTGSISIGLVNVPVRLMVMVREHTISFRLLHRKDGQPIEYKRVCQRDNKEVPWEDIVKGYEVKEGEYIMIEKEELDAVRPESDRKIRIDRFINVLSVDPVYYDRSYILVPDGSPEAYALMTEVFRKKGRAGVGKITLRTREYPALVREYQDALILITLHYPDEVINPASVEVIASVPAPGKKEISIAEKIIDDLSGELDLEIYHDTYREQIEELIKKKMAGETVHVERPKAEEARELMSALEETLARLKASKSDEGGTAAHGS